MYTKTHEVMLEKEIKKLKKEAEHLELRVEQIEVFLEENENAITNRKITEDGK